jgi:hypothetical protein
VKDVKVELDTVCNKHKDENAEDDKELNFEMIKDVLRDF